MGTRERNLQERIELLADGASLDECIAGLPDEEAALMRLVAELRELRYPGPDPVEAADRRARFLAEAASLLAGAGRPAVDARPSNIFSRLPIPVGAAAAIAAFVLVGGVALVAGLGGSPGGTGGENAGVLASPTDWLATPTFVPAPDSTSASLNNLRGLVEIMSDDGTWMSAEHGDLLQGGGRVRTGGLSSATLALFDGSLVHLGPGSELAIDGLDARTDGPRVVELTQLAGETDHEVTESTVEGSRYLVNTPSGSGEAKGTRFTVATTTSLSLFDVSEGSVAVTNLDVTVLVVAGQAIVIEIDRTPPSPLFTFGGEGEVIEIGTVWRVAGSSLLTDAHTIVLGTPRVGDWVRFGGRILPDGSRVVDLIVLVRRSPSHRFELSGMVDAIRANGWTVSGTDVAIDAHTSIDSGIGLGDAVVVAGRVGEGGTLLADSIHWSDDDERHHFEFVGVVNSMGDPWVISGVAVDVNEATEIEDGIALAAIVSVQGWILPDGSRLAEEIELAETDEHEFSIVGTVQSIDPWRVSGVNLGTSATTEIDSGIEVGDLVRAEGLILADGTWVAEEIELVAPRFLTFDIIGEVESVNPWIVSGLTFATDADTDIEGAIVVGDLVHVRGRVLDNGTLLAEEIVLLPDIGLGCSSFSGAVNSFTDTTITLHNFETIEIEDELEIEGDLQIASVILVQTCTSDDGTIVIVNIIIIFQLDELPVIIIEGDDDDDD